MNYNDTICVTYFDKNYLLKGLALQASLSKHNPNIRLWILCFDKYTKDFLNKLNLSGVTAIALKDFEDSKLLAVKDDRTKVEYCWTSTPSLPLYVFKKDKKVNKIIYLDADLFFYSSITPAIKELGKKSIYTVKHRYPKEEKHRENVSGIFNVGFQIFKRDKESLKCLRRWRKQCLDWCYFREEDGKLGDQMYLNEWPQRYKSLVISKNLGVDAAPWNIRQYKVTSKNRNTYINNDKLMCYHFHQFDIISENDFSFCKGYNLSRAVVKNIYTPYVKEIKRQIKIVKSINGSFKINKKTQSLPIKLRDLISKYFGPQIWKIKSYVFKK